MGANIQLYDVRNTRDSEESPAAMEQVFSAFGSSGSGGGFFTRLLFGTTTNRASFEIVSVNSRIHFFLGADQHAYSYLESQMTAQYPRILLSPVQDYAPHFFALPHVLGGLRFTNSFYYPLKTYKDIKDLDLLASVLGQMAKLTTQEAAAIQYVVSPAGSGWQRRAAGVLAAGIPDPGSTTGRTKTHPQARLIESKIAQVGLVVGIRLLTVAPTQSRARELFHTLSSTFGVFTLGDGNGLSASRPAFWQVNSLQSSFLARTSNLTPRHHVMSASEVSSVWHPPWLALSSVKNISWGAQLAGEAPETLPVPADSEEEQRKINFFAKTDFKNKTTTFGIKKDDRRKHLYIIGKTGTGKSTMIANMAINDMRNGEGLAIIDPHGDLCDILLNYIPAHRINDVAYLDPSDTTFPFHINTLEVKNESYRELVASGIVAIFHKLYYYSWGPRLEYILRNTILTLLHVPQATFLQVPELLTDEKYRAKIVEKIPDKVLRNFWLFEFAKMSPQMRSEAVSPILNKVGQFLSSQTIRNIVGHHTSTIDLEEMMDKGKIVIVNLSQGKLGEDNSALLGAMIITKIQLASMNRVYMAEEQRRDFYLYVDEFQNFATSSFIKILSEARKYRLNITLANQYIGQIDEEVQKAIFGNAGSIVTFSVGAQDARLLSREFGEKYKEDELVGLGNFQVVMKLSIDNHTSRPFSAVTLPLPHSINKNREKVIRSSRERYTKHDTKPASPVKP